jgi:hypothetical protein
VQTLDGPRRLVGVQRENDRGRSATVVRQTVGLIDEQMVGLGDDSAGPESPS